MLLKELLKLHEDSNETSIDVDIDFLDPEEREMYVSVTANSEKEAYDIINSEESINFIQSKLSKEDQDLNVMDGTMNDDVDHDGNVFTFKFTFPSEEQDFDENEDEEDEED